MSLKTPLDDLAVLDDEHIQTLKDLCQGTTAVISELLAYFEKDIPDYIIQLETSAARGDLKSVEFTSHKIQGIAGNIGALRLRAYVADLEDFVRDQHAVPPHFCSERVRQLFKVSLKALQRVIADTPHDEQREKIPA